MSLERMAHLPKPSWVPQSNCLEIDPLGIRLAESKYDLGTPIYVRLQIRSVGKQVLIFFHCGISKFGRLLEAQNVLTELH